MEIKLVAIDVDGTLLDDQHRLPPENEAAIKKALGQGVQIILATGRMRGSCAWVIERLGLQSPGIFIQGLHVADVDGKRIYGEWLDTAVLHQLLDFATAHQLSFVAFGETETYTTKRDHLTDIVMSYDEPVPQEVDDITAYPIHKIIVFDDPKRVGEIRPLLQTHMNGQADVLITQPEMVEVMPAGTSKGRALAWLMQQLAIPMAQVMAIGNAENDMAMLQTAGVAVAVANAAPHVQAEAHYVVGTNNQAGVAEAINRFVLL